MPNCFRFGNGSPSQVLPGGVPAILNTDFARSLGNRGSPKASRRQRSAHARGVLRANVRSGRSPWSPGALPIECAPEGRFLAHRIDRCCAHTQGYLARGNPRPRKYPPKYPQCGRSKNPAFSRVCEKYPQYPRYPRDAGDALSHARKTIFARLDVRPSNAPQRAVFGLRFVCGIRPHPRINPRVTRKSTKYPRISDPANQHDCSLS